VPCDVRVSETHYILYIVTGRWQTAIAWEVLRRGVREACGREEKKVKRVYIRKWVKTVRQRRTSLNITRHGTDFQFKKLIHIIWDKEESAFFRGIAQGRYRILLFDHKT